MLRDRTASCWARIGPGRARGFFSRVADAWFALFAPAGTPPPIITRLAADTQAYTQDTDVRGRLAELGIEPSPSTPQELRRTLRNLTDEYRELVRSIPAAQR